jgi:hypothetical protein
MLVHLNSNPEPSKEVLQERAAIQFEEQQEIEIGCEKAVIFL